MRTRCRPKQQKKKMDRARCKQSGYPSFGDTRHLQHKYISTVKVLCVQQRLACASPTIRTVPLSVHASPEQYVFPQRPGLDPRLLGGIGQASLNRHALLGLSLKERKRRTEKASQSERKEEREKGNNTGNGDTRTTPVATRLLRRLKREGEGKEQATPNRISERTRYLQGPGEPKGGHGGDTWPCRLGQQLPACWHRMPSRLRALAARPHFSPPDYTPFPSVAASTHSYNRPVRKRSPIFPRQRVVDTRNRPHPSLHAGRRNQQTRVLRHEPRRSRRQGLRPPYP